MSGGDHRHISASLCQTKFSTECGAAQPKTLRATKLRKQLATVCSTLDFTEDDVNKLASYMGHSAAVHKDVYRQPIIIREITKMSQLLEDVRDGVSGGGAGAGK